MGWPLSQEYNEAVQNPRTAFGDPELKAGEVVPGPLGIPMPRSGNFADVYQFRADDGRMWALKCFTRPAAGLRERYLKIDAHLRTARLPFTVGFQFLPEGVRVRGLWFPVLKMEWVEGQTLNEFVRKNIEKPDHLKALLGLWIRLCKRLRDSRMAHADLQHGNVLLVPGTSAKKLKLRLIDYDGMFVPALSKSPSGEVGHPAYQHPLRLQKGFYTADVDRFPHLVIGCALRALAVAGKPLWDRFDNGDNMLFREADLADPTHSPLFKALWQLDDPTVTNLLSLLIVCASHPIAATPWLDEILEGDTAVPVKEDVLNYAADVLGVPRRAVRQSMPVAQIFVVPEEANDFSDLEYDGETFIRRRKKRPLTLTQALLGFGGVALIAAAIIVSLLLMQKEKVIDLGLPIDPQPIAKAPEVKVRTGLFETDWHKVVPGSSAYARTELVSGLDTAPPSTKLLRTFAVGEAASQGAWFLPDGRHALIAGKTGLAILDLHTKQVTPIPQVKGELHRVAFSPSGKHFSTVTTVGKEQVIHCFDFATGEKLWSNPFEGPVGALAFTPDALRLAASGDRIGYREWNVNDGKEARRHGLLQASAFCFTRDGKHAIAANENGVELWSLDEGTARALSNSFLATLISISPDGKQAFAAAGREIKSWELPSGETLPDRHSPVKSTISAMAFGPGGILLVGSQAGEIAYVEPDETPASLPAGKNATGPIVSFSTTSDGQYALTASEKAGVILTRLADLVRPEGPSRSGPKAGCLELVRSMDITSDVIHFATDGKGDKFLTISVENRRVAKGEPDTIRSRVNVYDSAKLQRQKGLPPLDGRIVSAGFGGSQFLVTCESTPNGLRTWARDLTNNVLAAGQAFKLDEKELETVVRISAVPHPVKNWVLVTTESAGDVLFDINTAVPVPGWPESAIDDPRSAIASLDGQRLALVSKKEPIRIWESENTRIARSCVASEGVRSLAFLPDPTLLVGIWPEGRIRVWDVSTGKIIRDVDHEYPGPFSEIAAITNNIVLIGPAPNRFLLNIDTGKALNTGNGPDPLLGRGFSMPGSDLIFATDRDERLSAWRVNPKTADALPAKPPQRSAWSDIGLLRDAPHFPCAGLTFASNGKNVLVASQDGRITRYTADRLLQIEESSVKPPAKKGKEPNFHLRAMRQGADTLLLLSEPFKIASRNAVTMEKIETAPAATPTGSAQAVVAVHPGGKYVLLSTNVIRLWELQEDKTTMKEEFGAVTLAAIPRAALGQPLTHFAWSADGSTGLARWGDKVTAAWHPKKIGPAKILEELKAQTLASSDAIALSPDGQFGILGLSDGPIRVWDTRSGKAIENKEEYLPHRDGHSVTAIAALPNGRNFLSAGRNGKLILWETASLKKLKEYRCPEGPWRVAIAPDGRTAIVHQPGYIARIDLPAEGKP